MHDVCRYQSLWEHEASVLNDSTSLHVFSKACDGDGEKMNRKQRLVYNSATLSQQINIPPFQLSQLSSDPITCNAFRNSQRN